MRVDSDLLGLPLADPLSSNDALYVVQNGKSKRTTVQALGGGGGGGGGVDFVSNGGSVQAGPHGTVSGGTPFGTSTGQTSFEFLTVGQLFRIRQAGDLNRCRVQLGSIAGITGLFLKVWRASPTADGSATFGYDLVGTSQNLASGLVVGSNTFTLAAPITVKLGDYIGLRVQYSAASAQNFFSNTVANTQFDNVATVIRSVTNSTPSQVNFDWNGQTGLSGSGVVIEVFMAAPIFVTIGDSIVSGLESQTSFHDSFRNATRLDTVYSEVLSRMTGWTCQNAGIGGDTVDGVAARFATDVVAKNPKFVVIDAGANNINNPGFAGVPAMISLFTNMLDQAHTAHILPVIIGVFPFRSSSNGSDLKMQQRDQLNAALKTLVTSPPYNGVYVSADIISYHFPGGDPNNLWNVGYAPTDALHPGPEGHVVIAQAILDGLNGKVDIVDTTISRNAGEGNTAYGVGSATFNVSGYRNTAFGSYCLYYGNNGFANTAVGYGAAQTTGYQNSGANNNTAIGYGSLLRNIAGISNTAVGSQALFSNLSNFNDAFGANALLNNSSGTQNASFGGNSLGNNTTGSNNTAFGVAALFNNTTASENTALGHDALENNTTGFENTAVGSNAAIGTTTGAGNVAVGFDALFSNTAGNSNVAVGLNALLLADGTGNVAVGANALADATASPNVAVGFATGRGIVTGTGNTILGSNIGSLPAGLANSIILASNGLVRADFQFTNGSLWTFSSPICIPSAPPATSASVGAVGEMTWDSGFLYVCVAANSWRRVALATF